MSQYDNNSVRRYAFNINVRGSDNSQCELYVDGEYVGTGVNFNLMLNGGTHKFRVCRRAFINSKWWPLLIFNPLMYIGFLFGYTDEVGFDGKYSQICFRQNVCADTTVNLSLTRCVCEPNTWPWFAFKTLIFRPVMYRFAVTYSSQEIGDISTENEVTKQYMRRWKLVHGLLPCLMAVLIAALIVYDFLISPYNVWLMVLALALELLIFGLPLLRILRPNSAADESKIT